MAYDPAQVYQPEADTFLLLAAARAEVRSGDRVLEIGTGTGHIAMALAQNYDIVVTDINPHAVLCAQKNGLNVVRNDLCVGIRGTFDLVIFNPPYLPTRPEERIDDWLEYALDGGITGREVIGRFAKSVGNVLSPSGRILLLVSSLTGIPEIRDLFEKNGFLVEIFRQETIEDEILYVLRITRDNG
jgi:release factor glutamine methyltransferase